MNFAKFVATVCFVLSVAAGAEATTSSFGGTGSADTILVGRAYDGGGLVYAACINGEWVWGSQVTGGSDYVYVSGYGGSDNIKVRDVNDIYNCGGIIHWLYRMDYQYACPYRLYLLGGTGNDRIFGAQCIEDIYGEAGADSIFPGGEYDWVYSGSENDCIQDDTIGFLDCGDGANDQKTHPWGWKNCEYDVSYCFITP